MASIKMIKPIIYHETREIGVILREHHADPPPQKWPKLSSRSQKLQYVLNRMQKQFSDFLKYFCLTKFSF